MNGQVLVMAGDILDFLRRNNFSRGGGKRYHTFDKIINDLKTRIRTYENLERDFYNLYKIKDLKDFQSKIDKINESGLMNFSARALSNSSLFKHNLQQITNETFLDAFAEFILSSNNQKDLNFITDETIPSIVEDCVDYFLNNTNEDKNINAIRSQQLHNTASVQGANFRLQLGKLIALLPGGKTNSSLKFLSTYKKEIAISLGIQPNSTWNYEVEVPDELDSSFDPDAFYPYFNLTPDEAAEAAALNTEKSRYAWSHFKEYLKSLISISIPDFEGILNKFGPASFIKNNTNGVQGILGEVQMALILNQLGIDAMPTGFRRNLLSENQAELGADLLLQVGAKQLGFQVKNYKGYGAAQAHGYHLTQDLNWSTLEKRIKKNAGDNKLESLGEFFAIRAFNQPITRDKNDVQPRIDYPQFYKDKIESQTTNMNNAANAYFAENWDSFITLQEAYKFMTEEAQEFAGSYNNVFFFFGGKTLVPTSYLYKLILQRVITFINAVENKEPTNFLNFRSRIDIEGAPVYQKYVDPSIDSATYRQKMEELNPYTFNDILAKASVHIDFNIYLRDLNLEGGGPIINWN